MQSDNKDLIDFLEEKFELGTYLAMIFVLAIWVVLFGTMLINKYGG
jgi:hypothetical protein